MLINVGLLVLAELVVDCCVLFPMYVFTKLRVIGIPRFMSNWQLCSVQLWSVSKDTNLIHMTKMCILAKQCPKAQHTTRCIVYRATSLALQLWHMCFIGITMKASMHCSSYLRCCHIAASFHLILFSLHIGFLPVENMRRKCQIVPPRHPV